MNKNWKFIYYRLKQIDFDGRSSYSDIKSIKPIRLSNTSIFPNPVTREQSLQVFGANISSYKIYNNLGQEVLSKSDVNQTNSFSIELNSDFSSGIYIIVFDQGEKLKFIVK